MQRDIPTAKRSGLIVTVQTEHLSIDLPARYAPHLDADWVRVCGFDGVQDNFPTSVVRAVSVQRAAQCPLCGEYFKPVYRAPERHCLCPFCEQVLALEDGL